MICKAVYDTEAEIPEFAKADFERRADGKFYLKPDAIPGAAELLNPGLASNRDRALEQKQRADDRATAAETRAANAEAELSRVRTPGAVVLSGEDAKQWQALSSLDVPVKEIVKVVKEEVPTLRQKVARAELEATLRDVSTKSALPINADVLSDWLSGERGKGLKVVLKPTETDDGKGGKTVVQMPYIVKSEPTGANTFKETETGLIEYATANLPSYLVTALQTPAAGAEGGGATGSGSTGGGSGAGTGGAPVITGSVRLPNLGGASPAQTGSKKGGDDAASIVAGFNAERDTRKNPLMPTAPAQTTAGQGTGQG